MFNHVYGMFGISVFYSKSSRSNAMRQIHLIECKCWLQDVTVIILDVGKSANESPHKPTFFEREKECVQKILLRKVKMIVNHLYR